LLVTRGHNHQSHAHEDVYVAIRDAFDAAKRRLEDYACLQRGDVKRHAQPQLAAQAGEVEPEAE